MAESSSSPSCSTVTISTLCSDTDLPPSYTDTLIKPHIVRVRRQDCADGDSPAAPVSWLRYKWKAVWHLMKVNNNLHKLLSILTLFLVIIGFTINYRRAEDRHLEVYKHIDKFDQHVNRLDREVNNIQRQTINQIEDVNNTINNLNQQTATLASKISDLDDRFADLKQMVKQTEMLINNKIDHFDNKTANLDAQTADLDDRADNIEVAVKQMKERIVDLQNNVEDANKTAMDSFAAHSTHLGGRADAMEELMQQLKKQMLDKINHLQKDFNTLKEDTKKATEKRQFETKYARRISSYTNGATTSKKNAAFTIIILSLTYYVN